MLSDRNILLLQRTVSRIVHQEMAAKITSHLLVEENKTHFTNVKQDLNRALAAILNDVKQRVI